MHPKSPRWLEDIALACANIAEWTTRECADDYETNTLVRSAVGRNFEIIGEALVRLERADPEIVARITDYRRIIGFRNRLAHGYDDIDHGQVWKIISDFLPILRGEIEILVTQADAERGDQSMT